MFFFSEMVTCLYNHPPPILPTYHYHLHLSIYLTLLCVVQGQNILTTTGSEYQIILLNPYF